MMRRWHYVILFLVFLPLLHGTTIDACQDISTSGDYFLNTSLSNEASTCFTINVSHVTLDCQGNTVDGQNLNRGIYLLGESDARLFNVSVVNCVVNDFSTGIYYVYVNDSYLQHTTVNSSASDGITIKWSRNVTTTNLTSTNNGGRGMFFWDTTHSVGNLLTTVLNANDGIDFLGMENGVFTNITTMSHTGLNDDGFVVRSGSDSNYSDIVTDSNRRGMLLDASETSSRFFRINFTDNTETGLYVDTDNGDSNYFYDNFFNNTNNTIIEGSDANYWNISLQDGVNIVGGSNIGGNYWATSAGTGYSENCSDANSNGICDTQFDLGNDALDFLPLTIAVDNDAPNISMISPDDNYNGFAPADVSFSCNATDDLGLANLSLYLTDRTNASFSLNNTSVVSGTFNETQWNLSLGTGNYTWGCGAIDTNNANAFSNNRSVSIDNSDSVPTVNLVAPGANYVNDSVSSLNMTFSCSASDDAGLTNLSLYLTNSSNQSFALNESVVISGTGNQSNWTMNLTGGNYTWNCLASDSSAQSSFASANRSIILNFTAVCGNGIIEDGEVCDTNSFDGASCTSLGFDGGGSLSCVTGCSVVSTASCSSGGGGGGRRSRSGRVGGTETVIERIVTDRIDGVLEEFMLDEYNESEMEYNFTDFNYTYINESELNITFNETVNISFVYHLGVLMQSLGENESSSMVYPMSVLLENMRESEAAPNIQNSLERMLVSMRGKELSSYQFERDMQELLESLQEEEMVWAAGIS